MFPQQYRYIDLQKEALGKANSSSAFKMNMKATYLQNAGLAAEGQRSNSKSMINQLAKNVSNLDEHTRLPFSPLGIMHLVDYICACMVLEHNMIPTNFRRYLPQESQVTNA